MSGIVIPNKVQTMYKKRLHTLLAATAIGVTTATMAATVYTENFQIYEHRSSLNTAGWSYYLTNNTGVVDRSSIGNSDIGDIYNYTGNKYAYSQPKADGSYPDSGPGLMFTTDTVTGLDSTDISDLSMMSVALLADGTGGDPALGRLAIQIGSQWYASDETMTSTSNTGPTGSFANFQLSSTDFDNGNNWRLMTVTTGVAGEISVGSIAGGTLSGDVTAFGVYSENGNSGDHFRIDDFSITVIPEPSTLILGLLAGLGMMFRRRRN